MNPNHQKSNQANCTEWFAGIGGFHCAWKEILLEENGFNEACSRKMIAFDINDQAKKVYGHNFTGPYHCQTIESLSKEKAKKFGVTEEGFWWMSPPCQPFTQRGLGRMESDPRSQAFWNLLSLLESFQPTGLGLENVPEFWNSPPCKKLLELLFRLKYHVAARFLCPTSLGIPMRRKRLFLIASKKPLQKNFDQLVSSKKEIENAPCPPILPLSGFLMDPAAANQFPELFLEPAQTQKYSDGMNVLMPSDQNFNKVITNCFTKAYGKSFSKSGSFLETEDQRIRRFHPVELLGLFGFPKSFRFPANKAIPLRTQYALIGNSLSVDCVRFCLRGIFGDFS